MTYRVAQVPLDTPIIVPLKHAKVVVPVADLVRDALLELGIAEEKAHIALALLDPDEPLDLHSFTGSLPADFEVLRAVVASQAVQLALIRSNLNPEDLIASVRSVRLPHRQGNLHNYGWNDAVDACCRALQHAIASGPHHDVSDD